MDRADHLGKPVTRLARPILAAALLAIAAPAAVAQEAVEILSPAVRDVTPPRMTQIRIAPGAKLRRLPALFPPPPPPEPARRVVWPRAEALASGGIASRGERIVVAGIRGLAPEETCGEAAWPCGAHARAALSRLLRMRSIECDPANRDADGRIVAACSVGGRDIGLWLVSLGWAEADGPHYRPAMDIARAAGLGKWGAGPPPY